MPAVDNLLKAPAGADNFPDEPASSAMPDRGQSAFSFGDFMAKTLPDDGKNGAQHLPGPNQKSSPSKKQSPATDFKPPGLTKAISTTDEPTVDLSPKKNHSSAIPAIGTKKSDSKTDENTPVNQVQTPDPAIIPPVLLTLPISTHFNPLAGDSAPSTKDLLLGQNADKTNSPVPSIGNMAGNPATALRPENLTAKSDAKLDILNLKPVEEKVGEKQATPSAEESKTGSKLQPPANLPFNLNSEAQSRPIRLESSQAFAVDSVQNPSVADENAIKAPEKLQFTSFQPTPAAEDTVDKSAGTGVAIDAGAMKNSEKTNKFAGSGMKNLPGGKIDPAHTGVSSLTVATAKSHEDLSSDLNFSSSGEANSSVIHDAGTLVSIPALTTDANVRTAERTSEMVALHAIRLARSDSDSLSVVIKPGGGTELSLELCQKNGVIEAQAVLQHGDFQALNQHWPDLQQKLEQRGIKLAALGGENNSSAGDLGQFSRQQKNQSPEESAQQASAFAEFTMAMNRGGATARLATVANVNANEWWA